MIDAILRSASQRKLSVLVGAGASLEPPSGSCGWYEFRDEVLVALLQVVLTPNTYDESWIRCVEQLKTSQLSPEVLLNAIDRFSGPLGMSQLRTLCLALDLGHPNRTHISIAALVKHGSVQHVFTTNWDSFLERALEQQEPLLVVRDVGELRSDNKSKPERRLMYLHGSVRGRYVQGGLWRLGFKLNAELERELLHCAAGQDLLVLGYSGADWDILEVLDTAVARHDTRLFWLHLPGRPVATGVLRLQTEFPERVHLLAIDMNEVLAQLCDALGVRPGPPCHASAASAVASARRDHLSSVARDLGRFRSCLSLACCTAACGLWKQAWEWCSLARDIAYDNVPLSAEPHLQGAAGAEALRLGTMCLACGGDLDTAGFYLRNLRTDLFAWAGTSGGMRVAVNGFIEYASTVSHLCSGDLRAAHEALSAGAGSFNLLAHLRTMSGHGKHAVHPMTEVSFWQLQCLLRVLEEEGLGDGKILEQRLIETDVRIRMSNNLWGHCSHLLNVANFYYKWHMRQDAMRALADCLRESQQYGIRVCERIARQNIRVIEGKVSDPGSILAPVVDRMSAFGVVPDVFCVSLAIRPTNEE